MPLYSRIFSPKNLNQFPSITSITSLCYLYIQVINSILSDSLPKSLQQLDRRLSLVTTKEAGDNARELSGLMNFSVPANLIKHNETELESDPTVKQDVLRLHDAQVFVDAGLDRQNDDISVVKSDDEFERRYLEAVGSDAVEENVNDEYDDTLDQFGLSIQAGEEEQDEEEEGEEKVWGRNKATGGRWKDHAPHPGRIFIRMIVAHVLHDCGSCIA